MKASILSSIPANMTGQLVPETARVVPSAVAVMNRKCVDLRNGIETWGGKG